MPNRFTYEDDDKLGIRRATREELNAAELRDLEAMQVEAKTAEEDSQER